MMFFEVVKSFFFKKFGVTKIKENETVETYM